MILDDAIKHAEEVAEEKENEGKLLCQSEGASIGCLTCAEEHRQLAEWLRDYKRLKEQEPKTGHWIPVSERLPKPYTYVNATCRSLADDRENWVVETMYLPIPKENDEQGYSDWGNIPMLNWGKAEVIAWMERKIPEPYKAESEE